MAKANITPADYSNEFLLIHTLNCDKQLGKCSVPGCGIAKGVFEYLLGKRELLKDTIYPIFKRSFVEESSGKRRKLRDGERERLLLPYPPRPDDFIKKEVEYTLSSEGVPVQSQSRGVSHERSTSKISLFPQDSSSSDSLWSTDPLPYATQREQRHVQRPC